MYFMKNEFKLYSYFRSSASFRVRIALHLKAIPFEYISVHLLKNGGEQYASKYKELNPLSQVPTLLHNGQSYTQSMAIIQYLDHIVPNPVLFPKETVLNTVVTQFCEIINSGIQPLQNSSVTQKLEAMFQMTPMQKADWYQFWMSRGFTAIESMLKIYSGKYSFGDQITAADCFLAPQMYSCKRFGFDTSPYERATAIYKNMMTLDAFQKAAPENQTDAE